MKAKMHELAARFAAQVGNYRAVLEQAMNANDLGEVQALAHKLAGIAPMFGYENVGNAALDLEDAVSAGENHSAAAQQLDFLLASIEA
ncbi:hypothetical protein AMC99_02103 [Altererythrobacter epoxidivorans]|uniref:HPt domain-containing protein n=2 Tax=Altererythrobacter epoxidivorans TaxID=361183 RepID=A0A0M4M9B0_9SPHN|nr:hypothetical protein AMC99_02103 [Altererythrobacter epoxidivorans]